VQFPEAIARAILLPCRVAQEQRRQGPERDDRRRIGHPAGSIQVHFLEGIAMNTLHEYTVMSAMITLTAVQGAAFAAGQPVCAPSQDVNTVMGRGTMSFAPVHCQLERKVTQVESAPNVADWQGRGTGVVPTANNQILAVLSRPRGAMAVALVLGRSGFSTSGGLVADVHPMASTTHE